ncbi:MAG: lysyl-tRNA synthetase [Actinomycetota bacterium]
MTDKVPTSPGAASSEGGDASHDGGDATNLESFRERRLAEIAELRANGVNPYPYRFDRTHTLGEIRATHGTLEAGTETTDVVAITGRVMLKRNQGARSLGRNTTVRQQSRGR